MKLTPLFTLFTLSSLLVFNTAYANEPDQKQKTRQTKQSTKPSTKQQTKAQDNKAKQDTQKAPAPLSEKERLAEFNKNVAIQLVGRRIEMDQHNQPHTVFTYAIKNTGKNPIKAVHWVSAYTIYGNIFYGKDIPINFNPTLKAGTEVQIDISEPFSTLPDTAVKILGYLPNGIGAINGAKSLTFADGKQVIVNK